MRTRHQKIPYLRFKYKNPLVNSRPDLGSSLFASSTILFEEKNRAKNWQYSKKCRGIFKSAILFRNIQWVNDYSTNNTVEMYCFSITFFFFLSIGASFLLLWGAIINFPKYCEKQLNFYWNFNWLFLSLFFPNNRKWINDLKKPYGENG